MQTILIIGAFLVALGIPVLCIFRIRELVMMKRSPEGISNARLMLNTALMALSLFYAWIVAELIITPRFFPSRAITWEMVTPLGIVVFCIGALFTVLCVLAIYREIKRFRDKRRRGEKIRFYSYIGLVISIVFVLYVMLFFASLAMIPFSGGLFR